MKSLMKVFVVLLLFTFVGLADNTIWLNQFKNSKKDYYFLQALKEFKKHLKEIRSGKFLTYTLLSKVDYKFSNDGKTMFVKIRDISFINNIREAARLRNLRFKFSVGFNAGILSARVYDLNKDKFYFPDTSKVTLSSNVTAEFFNKDILAKFNLPDIYKKIVDVTYFYTINFLDRAKFGTIIEGYSYDPVYLEIYNFWVPKGLKLFWKVYNRQAFLDKKQLSPKIVKLNNYTLYSWKLDKIAISYREEDLAFEEVFRPIIKVSFNESWADYGRMFRNIGMYELLTRPDSYFKKLAKLITKDAKTLPQKVNAIIKWLNDNIHYLGIEIGAAGWIPIHPAETLMRKSADCKGYSTLLVKLLRSLGYKAYQAIIGSGTQLQNTPDFPYIVTNHMIAAVEYNGKLVIVDPTDTMTKFGTLPAGDQGKRGVLIIKYDDKDYVKYQQTPIYMNKSFTKITSVWKNNKLYSKVDMDYTIHNDAYMRMLLERLKKYTLKRKFKKYTYLNVGQIKDINYKNLDDKTKGLKVRFDFINEKFYTKNGQFIFIQIPPAFKSNLTASLTSLRKRHYPILLGPYNHYRWEINLKLPKGYKLINRLDKKIGDKDLYVRVYRLQKGDTVIVGLDYFRKKFYVTPKEYELLRKIYILRDLFSGTDLVLRKNK